MKALILIGPSGCGKSTFAKQFLKDNKDYIRINRDDIRRTLVADLEGYYQRKDIHVLEEMVSKVESYFLEHAHTYNKNILFDNTNLNKKHLKNLLKQLYIFKIEYEFKIFDISLPQCRRNVADREKNDSELYFLKDFDYIDKQFKQFTEIKKYINDTISTTSI